MVALDGRLLGSRVPDDPERLEDWTQTIRVSIRNLRSDMFITAGYASDVDIPRHFDIPTADGLYRSPRTLRRGDTYTAEVYTPRPPQNQRERVSTDFDSSLSAYTTIYTTQLGIPGAQHIRMTFPFFGDRGRPRSRSGRRTPTARPDAGR